jgi:hypothetical protein
MVRGAPLLQDVVSYPSNTIRDLLNADQHCASRHPCSSCSCSTTLHHYAAHTAHTQELARYVYRVSILVYIWPSVRRRLTEDSLQLADALHCRLYSMLWWQRRGSWCERGDNIYSIEKSAHRMHCNAGHSALCFCTQHISVTRSRAPSAAPPAPPSSPRWARRGQASS